MQKLSLIELFSGIGAQKKGIDNTGLWDCEVIATSEIDKDAIVSYAAMHEGLTPELICNYSYPSKEEMIKYLDDRYVGYDFIKSKYQDWYVVSDKELKVYYLACVLSKNLGNISKVEKLPEADMWTYSFPCTDISTMGEMQGLIKGQTRSGLLYEVERLLNVASQEGTLPKYLLLENVKNLTGKNFINQYRDWIWYLNELGYNNYDMLLNAKDMGIPQNRERVFLLSVRQDVDMTLFMQPMAIDNGLRLRDILDDTENVPYKFYWSTKYSEDLYDDFIKDNNIDISNTEDYIIRSLTPIESYRLMGFTDEDFNKAKAVCVAQNVDFQLYHQAGNSIVTNCIMRIMTNLYNSQYSNLDGDNITAESYSGNSKTNKIIIKGNLRDWTAGRQLQHYKKVYDIDGVSPTLMTTGDSDHVPKLFVKRKGR